MNQKISSVIRHIHQRIPVRVRKSYGFIIRFIKNLGKYILPVYHCHCTERESGEPLSLIYIGREKELLYYWLRRVSDDFKIIPGKKKILPSQVSAYLAKKESDMDLVLLESGKKVPAVASSRGFLLPRWMEMKMEFETFKGKSRRRNIVRNIKKHGLSYEVRGEMEDFELFYHKMYVPFVKMRHQQSADIADYVHFKSKFKKENALIFFALHEGSPVAGAYIEERENIHRLATFGILDGNSEIYRMGVLGALYCFVVEYLEEMGEKAIFMGNSLPVVFDGVTNFKMQIGAEPYQNGIANRESFFFIPMSTRPSMVSVLKSNPLFYLQENGLHAAFFLEAADFSNQEDFLSFYKKQASFRDIPVNLFCMDDPGKVKGWLEAEDLKKVKIHPYNEKLIVDVNHQERIPDEASNS